MRPKRHPCGEIPTSSMADIAFLLLVFFLVTTHFMEDKGLGLILPDVKSDSTKVRNSNFLNIVILDDNTILMDYRDYKEEIAPSTIREKTREFMEQNPEIIVGLRPSKVCHYTAMISVLDDLRAVDARKIVLSQYNG
jgi:biopolymer transport protein ExbD